MLRTNEPAVAAHVPRAVGLGSLLARVRTWDRPRGRLLAAVGLGLLLALITWPLPGVAPDGGIDGSWRAGIAMAFAGGMRWGVEIVWTYGPLGFLIWPLLWVPVLGGLAWGFVSLTHLTLCVTLVWLSLRHEQWRVALPLAFVAAPLAVRLGTTGELVYLALLVCFEVLGRDAGGTAPARRRLTLGAVGGVAALGAVVLLIKLNDGVAILALALATSVALSVRSAVLVAVGVGAVATLALWTVAGQQPGDLVAYLVTGREIASGYSTAMGASDPIRDWEYAAVPVAAVIVTWVLLRATSGWPRRQRIGALLAVAIVAFFAYKAGFVRHGGSRFFELLALVAVWMPHWTGRERERRFLVLAVLVTAALGTFRLNPAVLVNPVHVDRAIQQVTTLVSTDERVKVIQAARARLRATYALPATMIATIGDGGVHVEPYETSVLWAYPNLKWRPLPVFQPYSAYTDALDRLNASAIASPSGPEFILRQPSTTIDSRHPFFEAPISSLEMVCRFDETAATNRWQLLARGPSRCGPAEPLGTVTVSPGEVVTVPAEPRAGRIVVAHIAGIEAGPLAALRAFLDRSPVWWIGLTDQGNYRLVPETAAGPLMMSVPRSLGWTARYAPPSAIRSFTVVTGPAVGRADLVQPGVELTITFESISFQPD